MVKTESAGQWHCERLELLTVSCNKPLSLSVCARAGGTISSRLLVQAKEQAKKNIKKMLEKASVDKETLNREALGTHVRTCQVSKDTSRFSKVSPRASSINFFLQKKRIFVRDKRGKSRKIRH